MPFSLSDHRHWLLGQGLLHLQHPGPQEYGHLRNEQRNSVPLSSHDNLGQNESTSISLNSLVRCEDNQIHRDMVGQGS